MCRISAYLTTAFEAQRTATLTDAELRMSCSYTYRQCANPNDGALGWVKVKVAESLHFPERSSVVGLSWREPRLVPWGQGE